MKNNLDRKIFFRADGNSKIGLGHVIRTCALANMLTNDYECHFIIKDPLPGLKMEIEKAAAILHVLPEALSEGEELSLIENLVDKDDIVVLDGYHFKTDYQRRIKQLECRLVCIDDIHSYHFVADAVINHAGGIDSGSYSKESYTQLYVGPQFALLRQPFLKNTNAGTEKPDEQIFICMGGADPKNDTLEVLRQLWIKDQTADIKIVCGGGYLHKEKLLQAVAASGRASKISLFENLTSEEIAFIMSTCSIAVTPPSTIAFEYLSVGGDLYLQQIADNQSDLKKYFIEEGLAFEFSDYPLADSVQLETARGKRRKIFDGKSPERLKKIFQSLSA